VNHRQNTIIKSSWISIIGNLFLAILKIVAGIISGSMAVVADGIDSASDIATSVITLATAKILNKPPNVKFPYGYEKADTVATKALSFVIFFAGAQLAISTVKRIISGDISGIPSHLALIITGISIFRNLLFLFIFKKQVKR
jgi:cation diffusion facilitator family transporter